MILDEPLDITLYKSKLSGPLPKVTNKPVNSDASDIVNDYAITMSFYRGTTGTVTPPQWWHQV